MLIAGAVAAVVVGSRPNDRHGASASTVLGCAITPDTTLPGEGITDVDPICTQGAVIVRYCKVPQNDLFVPTTPEVTGQAPNFFTQDNWTTDLPEQPRIDVQYFQNPVSPPYTYTVTCGGSIGAVYFTDVDWSTFTHPGSLASLPAGCFANAGCPQEGTPSVSSSPQTEAPPASSAASGSAGCPSVGSDPTAALTAGATAVLMAWQTGEFGSVDRCSQSGDGLESYFQGHPFTAAPTVKCSSTGQMLVDIGATEWDCVTRTATGTFVLRIAYGLLGNPGAQTAYIADISFTSPAPYAGT